MAVLDLVSNVATDAPLLVVVDDAHWLDRPTSDVLAFVARRIEADPIVLLAAIREGYPSALGEAGLDLRHRQADDRPPSEPVSCMKRPGTRSPSSSCRPSSAAATTSSGRPEACR